MKAKVLKRFKDKYSGKFHEEGEMLTITRDRYNEILKVGKLVEEVKETKKAKNTAE